MYVYFTFNIHYVDFLIDKLSVFNGSNLAPFSLRRSCATEVVELDFGEEVGHLILMSYRENHYMYVLSYYQIL